MVLTSQKRVAIGICAGALLVSLSPIHSKSNNTAAKVATGCGIAAGILGLVGAVSAGIYYLSSKSDEQILEDAISSLKFARDYTTRFKPLYMLIFESNHYGDPTIHDVELHFLLPIAIESIRTNFSAPAHVDGVASSVSLLRNALTAVRDRIHKLEEDGDNYTYVYDQLRSIRSEIKEDLSYMEGYSNQLTRHKAFFELYTYESQLCHFYANELEIGKRYQHDPYLFEKYILQAVGAHGYYSSHPLIAYHSQLTDNIYQLEYYIRQLRYHYPSRTPLANQLLVYLRHVRGVIEASSAFKDEKRTKQEADDRAEWLIIQERRTTALEANAYATQMLANAQNPSPYAVREYNKRTAQQTVSVTFNT